MRFPKTSVVNGRQGAFLQPTRYGKNEAGRYTIFTWEGTKDRVLANVPAIEGAGGFWEMQESFTGAKCVLTARFPKDFAAVEAPVDTWEFFSQEVEKDILSADVPAINSISAANKALIRNAIDNSPDHSPAFADDPNALNLYLLMLDGLRSDEVDAPILRHTQAVSNTYKVQASQSNVGRVFTTQSLVTLEGVPGGLLFNLPNDSSNRTNLGYGWLKKRPTIRKAAYQKYQIEQEWRYGLWSPFIKGNFL